MIYDFLTMIEGYLSSYSLDSLSDDALCAIAYDCTDDSHGTVTGTADLAYKSLNEDCSTYDNEPEETTTTTA